MNILSQYLETLYFSIYPIRLRWLRSGPALGRKTENNVASWPLNREFFSIPHIIKLCIRTAYLLYQTRGDTQFLVNTWGLTNRGNSKTTRLILIVTRVKLGSSSSNYTGPTNSDSGLFLNDLYSSTCLMTVACRYVCTRGWVLEEKSFTSAWLSF